MSRTPLAILTLAALVAVDGCSRQPETKNRAPARAAAAPAAAPYVAPQLLALLPAKDEVPGWAFSRAPRGFTADNLFELIDGAADGFVAYGVQDVVTADYLQAGSGYQAVFEIYQMKDALNAFGKYSEERYPEYEFLEVGNEGYSGGTSLNFWSGPYYVKIVTFEEKDAIRQELVKLAQAVARKVEAPGAEPPQLSYFPKENQLPHTARYIPRDVLAQSYFANGFEARYQAGAKESQLVVIAMESAAAAEDGLSRYRQYVETAGNVVRDLKAPGEGGFAGKDSFYGSLAAVRSGKHLVVALGAASEDAGRKQLADVVRNIAKRRPAGG